MVSHSDTIGNVFLISSQHNGASPLDYLIVWVVGRIFGESELILRYLPLCWSVITIALTYSAAHVIDPRAGKWSALIAAISPLAIRYAQEVRFYSLGLMLGTATLTLAILLAKDRLKLTPGIWLCVTLISTATAYTHIYSVMLCAAGLIPIFVFSSPQVRLKQCIAFISALACAALLFAPWLFGSFNTNPHPMGTNTLGVTEISSILSGLELRLVLPANSILASLYPWCMILLYTLVVIACLRRSPAQVLLIGMLAIYLVSVIVVNLLTLRAHYFFHPRQFLFLLPIRALLFGTSLALMESTVLVKNVRYGAIAILVGVTICLTISATFIVITNLNRLERSNAKSIATNIMQTGGVAGRSAWMVPAWPAITIDFYLKSLSASPSLWNKYSTTDNMIQTLTTSHAPAFIVVDSLGDPLKSQLEKIGFHIVPSDVDGVYSLLIR